MTKIFVANLDYAVDEQKLKDIFGECGSITKTNIIRERATGRSKGFGFVEFSTSEEADRAVTEMNGKSIEGRELKVDKAHPEKPREQRGGYSRPNQNQNPHYNQSAPVEEQYIKAIREFVEGDHQVNEQMEFDIGGKTFNLARVV